MPCSRAPRRGVGQGTFSAPLAGGSPSVLGSTPSIFGDRTWLLRQRRLPTIHSNRCRNCRWMAPIGNPFSRHCDCLRSKHALRNSSCVARPLSKLQPLARLPNQPSKRIWNAFIRERKQLIVCNWRCACWPFHMRLWVTARVGKTDDGPKDDVRFADFRRPLVDTTLQTSHRSALCLSSANELKPTTAKRARRRVPSSCVFFLRAPAASGLAIDWMPTVRKYLLSAARARS